MSQISPVMNPPPTAPGPVSAGPLPGPRSFEQAMQAARRAVESAVDSGGAVFRSLQTLERRISSKATIEPRELLRFQMQAQELSLIVEFGAKAADAGLAAVRKLQSGS